MLRKCHRAGVITLIIVLLIGSSVPGVRAARTKNLILATLNLGHPRLLATMGDFNQLKERIDQDAHLKRWHQALAKQGCDLLKEPVSRFGRDRQSLMGTSRQILRRVYLLGLLFRLNGETVYPERVWQELQAIVNFEAQNGMLAVENAEMIHALAIGYDWLYDQWTDNQRKILRNAIVNQGIRPAIQYFRLGKGWVNQQSSYLNLVCNSGFGIGALAVAAENPDLAEALIQGTLQSLPNSLSGFQPDGAWDEGLSYWDYGTYYVTVYLAALDAALGKDFGLSNLPGLDRTALYPMYLTRNNFGFYYGDSAPGDFSAEQLFWLANRYHLPEVAWYQRNNADRNPAPLDLLWYRPVQAGSPEKTPFSLDRYFRGAEVVMLRSSWQEQAIIAGIKGCLTLNRNFNDLDQGAFVLSSNGVGWAEELGADQYDLPGYFDFANWQRWTYYRKMGEGQNVVVIDPGTGPEQDPAGRSEVIYFSSKPDEAGTIVDLSQAYARQVRKAWRGLFLLNQRRQIIVRDELSLKEPSRVWWFMHTQAKAQLQPDRRSALLSSGTERLWVKVLEPSYAQLQVLPAKPFTKSPNPFGQNPNYQYRKLAINLNGVKELRLSVLMVPLRKGETPPKQLPKLQPFAKILEQQ